MKGSSSAEIHALFKVAFSQVMLELILVLVLMVILVMSALYDYRERRIPNMLAFSGWLLGPVIHFAISGVAGLKIALLGLFIMLALTFPLWLLGSLGAGDVKLMAAVGALVGSANVLLVLFSILLAGLVYAVMTIFYALLGAGFGKGGATVGIGTENDREEGECVAALGRLKKEKIPYAIPIAFGTLIALLLTYR